MAPEEQERELERLESGEFATLDQFARAGAASAAAVVRRARARLDEPRLCRYYVNVASEKVLTALRGNGQAGSDGEWVGGVDWVSLANALNERAVVVENASDSATEDVLSTVRVVHHTLAECWLHFPGQVPLDRLSLCTAAALLCLGCARDQLTVHLLQQTPKLPYDERVYATALGALALRAPPSVLFRAALVHRNPVAGDVLCMWSAASTPHEKCGLPMCPVLQALQRLAQSRLAQYLLGALPPEQLPPAAHRFRGNDEIREALHSPHFPVAAAAARAAVAALRAGDARHPSELAVPNALKPVLIDIIKTTRE
ncbi:hypothetical protein CDCA_CDCA02G0618 [Cyanidium caldarium]|uniref:Uncharacterized protein n=1 Tax=Cyanidium caldarium TaxID=2771 RepID=A0AAV9IRD5_CYACA|nr:hypothetical protein CDCA_CDCA02G0618 [Cyanidium caldarium]